MIRLFMRDLQHVIPVYRANLPFTSLGLLSIAEKIDGMVAAVYALHSRNIIHRNIRPESFCVQNGAVVIGALDHAIYNLGPRSFEQDVINEFSYPSWGPVDPGLPLANKIKYGINYDVYCLGLCIAALLYPDQPIDKIDFNAPLDIPSEWSYRIIVRGTLHCDASSRFSTYALRNMCDIPHTKIWSSGLDPKADPIWYGTLIPSEYVKYMPMLISDPKLFTRSIINDLDIPVMTGIDPKFWHLQKIITWIGNFKWNPSWLYMLSMLVQNSYTDSPAEIIQDLIDPSAGPLSDQQDRLLALL